jgi:hypothetical protein
MSRTTLAMASLLLGLVAAGCAGPVTSPRTPGSASTAGAASEREQRDEGGEVTVEVAWDGPPAGAVFDVTLDTHSVDLDALDLSDAVLTNDRGETLAAIPWEAPKGGHHRDGRLAFDGDAAAFLADASWIELTLNGVGGVSERILRWEVPA